MRMKIFLLLFSILVALFLLEGTTRWLFVEIGSTADNTSYFAERWRSGEEGGTNSLGFREREIGPRDADSVRIAVVGDSLTYGQGIARPDRFTEQLDAALGDTTEIYNFGVPGANYDEHRRIMTTAIDAARPDAVILQWYINDVQPSGVHSPRPKNLGGPLHRFLQPNSALYFMANRAFGQLQRSLGLVASNGDFFTAFADPRSAAAVAARERLEAVIDIAETASVPLGIVLWPDVTDRGPEGDFLRHAALFDGVLEVCADRELPCLDLRPYLTEVPADRQLIVSRYDSHPNALANQIVAEAIRAWLSPPLAPPSV